MIGLITPPVCFLAYLTSTIADANFGKVIRESWIFILALILALATATYVPQLVLWLPNLLLGGK
jgi:TRAP-type C4-dicarboxylate transport system permease large subunit